ALTGSGAPSAGKSVESAIGCQYWRKSLPPGVSAPVRQASAFCSLESMSHLLRTGPIISPSAGAAEVRRRSLPGHQRGVDHVRDAFSAYRADRKVDILQAKTVGGHLFQRE